MIAFLHPTIDDKVPFILALFRLFNTQDFFNIINAQIASAFLSFKDGVEEFFFTFLEFLDFFLYGSKSDEAIDIDLFGLAKAVASSDGLHLDCWIPPEVTEDDGIGSC